MIKNIILVRHGETTQDKEDPERGLTARGKAQMINVARILSKVIDGKKSVIVCTSTKRSIQSAFILADDLAIPLIKSKRQLRVKNIKQIIPVKKISLTSYYLELYRKGKLPKFVTTPGKIVENFFHEMKNLNKSYETIIFVGHSGGLESILNFQSKYNVVGEYLSEFNYGDFVEMVRE